MNIAKDIGHNENELFVQNGDFSTMESDTMHVQDIIESYVGHWNEFPLLGVGARRFQGSSGQEQRLVREIKLNLTADNYSVDQIVVKNGKIFITGKRKTNRNVRI